MMPYSIFIRIYSIFNPCGKDDDIKWYELDKRYNFDSIRTMGAKKQMQIFDFLSKTENAEILKKIRNRTMILAGTTDVLMPVGGSLELNRLIKGSRLITVDKSHYGVIEAKSLEKIAGFLDS
jgi:pimeloyl-ACP methyl ester carboxylesterase